jgi:hypothetical protein
MLTRDRSREGRIKVETAEKIPGGSALVRHPWEITLREFIERVRRDYGIQIEPASAAIASGQFMSKEGRAFPVPVMGMDEVMPLPLLRFLCRLYRIPAADFHLDPED